MRFDEYGDPIDENLSPLAVGEEGNASEIVPYEQETPTTPVMPPKLIQRHQDSSSAADKNVESAQKQKDWMGYANVGGGILHDFANSQKSDIVLKNRMSDLGRKPNIIEADRPKYDRSILDNMGKEGVADAEKARARVDSSFQNQAKMEDYGRKSDAAARMSDPNSEESASAREYLKYITPDAAKIQNFDKMSAAQVEKVAPTAYRKYADTQKNKATMYAANQSAGLRQDARDERAQAMQDKVAAKNEELYVPGLGTARSLTDAKTLKDATLMKGKFDRQIQEMIDLRTKHNGGTVWNREDVERGQQLSKDLLLAYKDMAKLGVLSVSDENILNAIIPPDPLAYKFVGIAGQDPIMNNLKKFKEDTNSDYEQNLSIRLRNRENAPQTAEKKTPSGPMSKAKAGDVVVDKKTNERFTLGDDGDSLIPMTKMGGL